MMVLLSGNEFIRKTFSEFNICKDKNLAFSFTQRYTFPEKLFKRTVLSAREFVYLPCDLSRVVVKLVVSFLKFVKFLKHSYRNSDITVTECFQAVVIMEQYICVQNICF